MEGLLFLWELFTGKHVHAYHMDPSFEGMTYVNYKCRCGHSKIDTNV